MDELVRQTGLKPGHLMKLNVALSSLREDEDQSTASNDVMLSSSSRTTLPTSFNVADHTLHTSLESLSRDSRELTYDLLPDFESAYLSAYSGANGRHVEATDTTIPSLPADLQSTMEPSAHTIPFAACAIQIEGDLHGYSYHFDDNPSSQHQMSPYQAYTFQNMYHHPAPVPLGLPHPNLISQHSHPHSLHLGAHSSMTSHHPRLPLPSTLGHPLPEPPKTVGSRFQASTAQ